MLDDFLPNWVPRGTIVVRGSERNVEFVASYVFGSAMLIQCLQYPGIILLRDLQNLDLAGRNTANKVVAASLNGGPWINETCEIGR